MQLPHDVAKKLFEEGWVPNFADGSVTRHPDNRAGLVDGAVWQALRELVAASPAYRRTEPQALSAGGWAGEPAG